jgi:hypothetical protein
LSLSSSALRCEECGWEPDVAVHAAGWVAFVVDLADDPDPPAVVVYCPQCAARELDDSVQVLAEEDAI